MKKLLLGILVLTNVTLRCNDVLDAIKSRDPKQLEAIIKKYGKEQLEQESTYTIPGIKSISVPPREMKSLPLIYATTLKNKDMINMLLDAGVNINQIGSRGATALNIAAAWGYEDMTDLLLSRGADPKIECVLHKAVNHLSIVKKLIAKDKTLITQKDIHGNFPIHIAANGGSIDVLKELVKLNKASVTALDNDGFTPLELFNMGSNSSNPEFLECLVNNGANINQIFQLGRTVLISSIDRVNSEVTLKAIDLGANINISDSANQYTPLHYAVINCRSPRMFEIVKRLVLHRNINLDLKNYEGRTADQIMTRSPHVEYAIANKLIQWRRKVNEHFKPDPKKPTSLALSALLKAIRTRDRSEVINAVPAEYTNMVIAYYDCYGDSNLWSTPE